MFFDKLNEELAQESKHKKPMEDMDPEYQALSPQYKSHDEEDTNGTADHRDIDMRIQETCEPGEASMEVLKTEGNHSKQGKGMNYLDSPEAQGSNKGVRIQPIEFETSYWLTQFLASLF